MTKSLEELKELIEELEVKVKANQAQQRILNEEFHKLYTPLEKLRNERDTILFSNKDISNPNWKEVLSYETHTSQIAHDYMIKVLSHFGFSHQGRWTHTNQAILTISKYTDKDLKASKRNIILANKRRTNIVSSAMKKYWASLKEEAKKSRENFEKTVHKSYLGSKNSQFGTCWITKENINKKIKKEDLDTFISLGWVRGRK